MPGVFTRFHPFPLFNHSFRRPSLARLRKEFVIIEDTGSTPVFLLPLVVPLLQNLPSPLFRLTLVGAPLEDCAGEREGRLSAQLLPSLFQTPLPLSFSRPSLPICKF